MGLRKIKNVFRWQPFWIDSDLVGISEAKELVRFSPESMEYKYKLSDFTGVVVKNNIAYAKRENNLYVIQDNIEGKTLKGVKPIPTIYYEGYLYCVDFNEDNIYKFNINKDYARSHVLADTVGGYLYKYENNIIYNNRGLPFKRLNVFDEEQREFLHSFDTNTFGEDIRMLNNLHFIKEFALIKMTNGFLVCYNLIQDQIKWKVKNTGIITHDKEYIYIINHHEFWVVNFRNGSITAKHDIREMIVANGVRNLSVGAILHDRMMFFYSSTNGRVFAYNLSTNEIEFLFEVDSKIIPVCDIKVWNDNLMVTDSDGTVYLYDIENERSNS